MLHCAPTSAAPTTSSAAHRPPCAPTSPTPPPVLQLNSSFHPLSRRRIGPLLRNVTFAPPHLNRNVVPGRHSLPRSHVPCPHQTTGPAAPNSQSEMREDRQSVLAACWSTRSTCRVTSLWFTIALAMEPKHLIIKRDGPVGLV